MNWKATLKCRDCGTILNTAENVPEEAKTRETAEQVAGRGLHSEEVVPLFAVKANKS